ncbi:MAG: glycosyltransferase [Opitutales bacterium]|nr:glycosyltransferase [Opitutales bacterium]
MNENLTEIRTDSSSLREGSNPTAPKISVIVPVYKVEKYLPECIESILAQTFTGIKTLLQAKNPANRFSV